MRFFRTLLFICFICFWYGSAGAQNNSAQKKVVFIIVDGIAEDMLDSAAIPNLDRIAMRGTKLSAYVGGEKGGYSETPTISAVGYNSLLTGTWYNKHNVDNNYNQHPNYHYPTVFRLLKDQCPEKKIAIFSTWEDNRTVLIGEGKEATNYLKMDFSFDGLENDTLGFPSDNQANNYKLIDYMVAEKAADFIGKNGPDLSWVYLQHTDDVAHRYGDSKILYANISFEDGLVGRIYDAVTKRESAHHEDWLFIVTTDHGRDAAGKNHGGQSDRERNIWIIMNKAGVNDYAKTNRVPIVDIAPTILDFMNVNIPESTREEMDGVDLLEPVGVYNLNAFLSDDRTLNVTWKTTEAATGQVKLYITNTNHFRTGGTDAYQLIGTANSRSGEFRLKMKKKEVSGFYKIVLKTDDGEFLNTWIVNGVQK